VNRTIETICETEGGDQGQGRYPFVFFEEAHFYVSKEAILNIITRGRHIGMGSVFVTNTPQDLPDSVFRQLDNLLLLALTHRDDIKNVSKNSFTDEDTIESFATRMPEFHALVMGNVTQRYPLVLRIDALPANVPATGRTRSTWDRFAGGQAGPGR
jgi:DNA helicase HerA-like ATPase